MPWVQLVVQAVIAIAAIALAPRPPQPRPPSVEDFEVPTAEEGREIPVVFGTVLIKSPNVVWYGDIRYSRVRTKAGK